MVDVNADGEIVNPYAPPCEAILIFPPVVASVFIFKSFAVFVVILGVEPAIVKVPDI